MSTISHSYENKINYKIVLSFITKEKLIPDPILEIIPTYNNVYYYVQSVKEYNQRE